MSSTQKYSLFLFFFLGCLFANSILAQKSASPITKSELKQLDIQQDSLKVFANNLINAEETNDRFRADSFFVRTLVRTLKIPNSFYYPFDSLITISKLYAPDSSFKIFTWQLKKDAYTYMQRGAIQMRTTDGSLKLFPLHDASMFSSKPADSIRTNNNWIGAIYYRIIQKKSNGRNVYTLLGFDDFTIDANKKWMDILTFNDEGQPIFGGHYFSFRNDSAGASKSNTVRFYIEYKKEASTIFNYDTTLNMIIYDHLISESDQPGRKESYVPDGDYEGFVWENGLWLHVPKVFNNALQDGQYPQDSKILNDAGGIDEEKLKKQSEINKTKKPK